MFIEELDTTTTEGKILSVALSRLQCLYTDKSKLEILNMLNNTVYSFSQE
jgi:hypothetical protein